MIELRWLMLVAIMCLSGCGTPTEISPAVSDAVNACLGKGWVPRYWSNTIQVDFTCIPRKNVPEVQK